MKKNIHPQYEEVNVRCSCGNTGGRVEAFKKRFGMLGAQKH